MNIFHLRDEKLVFNTLKKGRTLTHRLGKMRHYRLWKFCCGWVPECGSYAGLKTSFFQHESVYCDLASAYTEYFSSYQKFHFQCTRFHYNVRIKSRDFSAPPLNIDFTSRWNLLWSKNKVVNVSWPKNVPGSIWDRWLRAKLNVNSLDSPMKPLWWIRLIRFPSRFSSLQSLKYWNDPSGISVKLWNFRWSTLTSVGISDGISVTFLFSFESLYSGGM